MSQNDHAPIAPSSAARIVMCPGSRRMEALYPQEDTIDTMEGEAAHWAAAESLAFQPVAVGQVAANGVTLNDEMVEAAELYAHHIIVREGGEVGSVERRVAADPHFPENYGTPDHAKYRLRHLFVDDFKFGHGFVDVMWNWQLIDYAYLLLRQADMMRDLDAKVTMTIVQPRNYHRDGPIRSQTLTVRELLPKIGHMNERFRMSLRDDAPCFATDPDICKNCSARGNCEAAAMAGWNAVPLAYASTPLIMSPAAVGLELRTLWRAQKQLAARVSGLEEHAMALAAQGANVPGTRVEHGSGRTVFSNKTDALAVADAMGVDIRKDDTITPAQAIKKGLPAEVVSTLTFTPRGSAKLVMDDGTVAARIFKQEQ